MNPKTSKPGKGPVLEVRNLTKTFQMPSPFFERLLGHPRRVLTAVSDVSFTIDPGQTFSLVGESGCGKSTLARTVAGLYRPDKGSVRLFGMDSRTKDKVCLLYTSDAADE